MPRAVALQDFSAEVGGHYHCQIKLSFKTALKSVALETIVQCNRGALPYLSPGKNVISVEVAAPQELKDNQLVLTYAYHPTLKRFALRPQQRTI